MELEHNAIGQLFDINTSALSNLIIEGFQYSNSVNTSKSKTGSVFVSIIFRTWWNCWFCSWKHIRRHRLRLLIFHFILSLRCFFFVFFFFALIDTRPALLPVFNPSSSSFPSWFPDLLAQYFHLPTVPPVNQTQRWLTLFGRHLG